MSTPHSDPAVADKVRVLIAEVMAQPEAKVRVDSLLMQDLGAESLDFLDVVFQLERAFDIEITRGEMERAARGNMSEDEFAPGGVISQAGLDRLRQLMPEAAPHIKPGLRPMEILSLFSVQTFVNLVEAKKRGETA